jgi:hypothetical protein
MLTLGNPVLANIGLPIVAVYLPPAWLALVPIIFVESGYGAWRYRFSFGRTLAAQAIANCISTLIGIPITWLVLVVLEFIAVDRGARFLPKPLLSVLTPVLGAAWLAPVPNQGSWIVLSAVLTLTIVFYLMSVVTEGFVVVRFFRDVPRKTIRGWMVQANGISYALLLLLIFGALFVPNLSEPAVRFMQPVNETMVDVVFLVVDQVSGTRKKEPPLIQAIQSGNSEKAKDLIANSVDVNQTDDVGFPALCIAASNGDENMTKLLLNAGASVNAPCATLGTALARAAQYGNAPTVHALLEAGAHVDDRDGAGWTPLFDAALKGDLAIVEALISAGANVNARTPTGWTALKEVQFRGHTRVAQRLIQAGAIDYPDDSRQ